MKVSKSELSKAILVIHKIAKGLRSKSKEDLIRRLKDLEKAYKAKDTSKINYIVDKICRIIVRK